MKINKIEIQVSNKKHATDVAMLLDKPEFILELISLRVKWEINNLFPVSRIESFTESEAVYAKKSEFDNDINFLLKKFNRGKNYKQVVEYALITGVIPDGIYSSCYFDVVTINETKDLNNPERFQYVIVLSPRTEKKELEQAYKEFREHIKGKIHFHDQNLNIDLTDDRAIIDQFHPGNIYNAADLDKFKTQKELDRTREWYWIAYSDKFNNISPKRKRTEDILTEWQLQKCLSRRDHENIEDEKRCPYCSIQDINIVDHALSAYSKLLKNS